MIIIKSRGRGAFFVVLARKSFFEFPTTPELYPPNSPQPPKQFPTTPELFPSIPHNPRAVPGHPPQPVDNSKAVVLDVEKPQKTPQYRHCASKHNAPQPPTA